MLLTGDVPTVADRVVLQAIRMRWEMVLEPAMADVSHAYRPRRGAHTALRSVVDALSRGQHCVITTDIRSFFDSIRHRTLLNRLQSLTGEAPQPLLKSAVRLTSGWRLRRRGIAQGSPLSPLLANAYLIEFDRQMMQLEGTFVRYADDLVWLTDNHRQRKRLLRKTRAALSPLGLKLHPDKTDLVDYPTEAFDYLGFRISSNGITPSEANLRRLHRQIDRWLDPRRSIKRRVRVDRLNGLLHSFVWYYHVADCVDLYKQIDAKLSKQLRRLRHRCPTIAPSPGEILKTTKLSATRIAKRRPPKKGIRIWNGYGA